MEIENGSKSKTAVSRRDFLKMCGFMAATLALPQHFTETIARALATGTRPPVIWLEFQDCTGDTASLLRAVPLRDRLQSTITDPSITDLLLNTISLDYHETLMVPSGAQSEKSMLDTIQNNPGKYIVVVEGAIPTANGGIYCTIRGKTALSIAQQVLPNALATIAAGTCAFDGGLSAAAPNLTGATGVMGAMPGLTNLMNLPGCPVNVVNLMATIVYLVTFNRLPDADSQHRPLFAYSNTIHSRCERRDYFEEGKFVRAWGDEGHKQGWCLFQMGCKGPVTHHNCSSARWNGGVSWPVAAGHGCTGCAEPDFWDKLTPVYKPLTGNYGD
jgi:hydrogenase small subunit